jgi:outer membrane protein TolC
MDDYAIGKDIQEIKNRLVRIEERVGLSTIINVDDAQISLLGERTKLVIANRTFRDVHVQLTKDVHTGNWGQFQLNHNSERDAESRK